MGCGTTDVIIGLVVRPARRLADAPEGVVALPPTQHPCGLVDGDTSVHAVQKKITGDHAACGAGRIAQPLAGRFDPEDRLACPACTGRMAPL
jgi:hypothetical protein